MHEIHEFRLFETDLVNNGTGHLKTFFARATEASVKASIDERMTLVGDTIAGDEDQQRLPCTIWPRPRLRSTSRPETPTALASYESSWISSCDLVGSRREHMRHQDASQPKRRKPQ